MKIIYSVELLKKGKSKFIVVNFMYTDALLSHILTKLKFYKCIILIIALSQYTL